MIGISKNQQGLNLRINSDKSEAYLNTFGTFISHWTFNYNKKQWFVNERIINKFIKKAAKKQGLSQ